MKHWYTTLFGALAAVAPVAHSLGVGAVGHVGSTDWLTLISGLGVGGLGLVAADAAKTVSKNGSGSNGSNLSSGMKLLFAFFAVLICLVLPIRASAQNECASVVPAGTKYTATKTTVDSNGVRHQVECTTSGGDIYFTSKAHIPSVAVDLTNLAAGTATAPTISFPNCNFGNLCGIYHDTTSTVGGLDITFGLAPRYEFNSTGFVMNPTRAFIWGTLPFASAFDTALLDASSSSPPTGVPAPGVVQEPFGATPINNQNYTVLNQAASSTNWDGVNLGFNASNDALLQTVKGSAGTARPLLIRSLSNCLSSGGTCGRNASGSVSIAAAATTVTVASTAVQANSQIFIMEDSSLGTALGITCNTTISRTYSVTARTAGTSFVITASAAPAVNPACLSFWVIN